MLTGYKSRKYLQQLRSKSKMFEYKISEKEHIRIPDDIEDLFIPTIGIIGEASKWIWSYSKIPVVIEGELKQELYFTSTFFDAYYQTKRRNELDSYCMLMAAVAYYYCDMIGSSKVMLNMFKEIREDLFASGLEEGILFLLLDGNYVIKYDCIKDIYVDIIRMLEREYNLGVKTGEISYKDWNEKKNTVYGVASDREVLFFDIILAIFIKKIRNSIYTLMPTYSNLNFETWQKTCEKNEKIKELWPAQIIIGENKIFEGQSGVVQMPTNSGKTASISLMIQAAFLSNRTNKVFVVAPFRALCKQIRYDLNEFFSFDENVIVTESSDIPEKNVLSMFSNLEKEIYVLTPEKLLYILKQDQSILENVNLMIFDEAHLIDSEIRGISFELLLTILKIILPKEAQKILISAVVSNGIEINDWINDNGIVIQNTEIKSTNKSIACINDRRLSFKNVRNNFEEEFFVPKVVDIVMLPKKNKEKNDRYFPALEGKEKNKDLGIYFASKLIDRGSIAIFSAKKNSILPVLRRYLKLLNKYDGLVDQIKSYSSEENKKIATLISKHYGKENEYYKSAIAGMLFHTSTMPNGIKNAVEYAIQKDLIKCIVCTSTLAQGVNLPIKYLIVSSIHQSKDPISVRDFQNLIGRSGRAGKETEGTVLLTQTIEKYRKQLVEENTEPCSSNLLKLVQKGKVGNKEISEAAIKRLIHMRYGEFEKYKAMKQKIRKIKEKGYFEFVKSLEKILISLENYFLYFIDNEENRKNLIEKTFGYFLATETEKKALQEIAELINGNLDEINLTEITMYQKSILGYMKMQKLKYFVEEREEELSSININEVTDVLLEALIEFGDCSLIPKIEGDERLNQLLRMWLNGLSYIELLEYTSLNNICKKYGEGTRKIKIEDILNLCLNDFSYAAMVVIQSVSDLLEQIRGTTSHVERYMELILRMRYGLSSMTEVYIYEIGFSDRILAKKINDELNIPQGISRWHVKIYLKKSKEKLKKILENYPSYFMDYVSKL